jgi:hypothetical protein
MADRQEVNEARCLLAAANCSQLVVRIFNYNKMFEDICLIM